ncbi:MAG: hypothetical protein ABFE08_09065 [Armatimonadia bacterium]
MANIFKKIGSGLLGGLDKAAAGLLPLGLEEDIQEGDISPQQKRAMRAALLSSIGAAIGNQRPEMAIPMYIQRAAPAVAARQQQRKVTTTNEQLRAAMAQIAPDDPQKHMKRAQIFSEAGLDKLATFSLKMHEAGTTEAPKATGGPQEVMIGGQKVLIQPMSDGTFKRHEGVSSVPKYTPVDQGGQISYIDPTNPGAAPAATLPKSMTPGESGTLGQRQEEFRKTFPLQQGQLAVSQGQLGVAQQNARTSQGHLSLSQGMFPHQIAQMDANASKARTDQGATRMSMGVQAQSQFTGMRDALDTVRQLKSIISGDPATGRPGTGPVIDPTSKDYVRLQALKNHLTMTMKEVYKLGALQQPEIAMMEKLINDPTSFKIAGREMLNPGALAQNLTEIEGIISRAATNQSVMYGFDPQAVLNPDYGKARELLRPPPSGGAGGGRVRSVLQPDGSWRQERY